MSTPGSRLSRSHLDRDQIVSAAIALADERGLSGASMRGVAEQLGVTPMALYKHVANHSDLVDDMLDRALEEVPAPDAGQDWITKTRSRILAARTAFAAHPWLREAIESRPLATPRTLQHMNALMADMFDGGLSADLVHHTMHALSTRMWGFTRDVLPTPQVPEDPDDRALTIAAFAARYPSIIRMATTSPHAGEACDDDAEFTFALDLILIGIQRLHERGWTRATSVSSGLAD